MNISPGLSELLEASKMKSKHALAPGLIELGNIPLHNRPRIENEDGKYSTVSTITAGIDEEGNPEGKTVLLPTIINGERVPAKDAVKHFKKFGEHMGIFETRKHADQFDKQLHKDMGWNGSTNKWDE